MSILTYISSLLLAFWFGFSAPVPGETIRVIVHESVSINEIDANGLLDIYLLNSQNWGDGSKIYVTDFKGSNELKNRFYELLKMKPAEIQKIWLKKQFSGKAIPPTTVNSEEELIKRVVATKGAIGYVTSTTLPEGVKVIARFN